eukprot:gene13467-biopygen9568
MVYGTAQIRHDFFCDVVFSAVWPLVEDCGRVQQIATNRDDSRRLATSRDDSLPFGGGVYLGTPAAAQRDMGSCMGRPRDKRAPVAKEGVVHTPTILVRGVNNLEHALEYAALLRPAPSQPHT